MLLASAIDHEAGQFYFTRNGRQLEDGFVGFNSYDPLSHYSCR
jgi:hypothetical protein